MVVVLIGCGYDLVTRVANIDPHPAFGTDGGVMKIDFSNSKVESPKDVY
jgi:hypothetical protein